MIRSTLRASISRRCRRTSAPFGVSPPLPAEPPAIIAVVKANAYGHGAERVALALEEAGATMLACADIEEGIVLASGRRARADPGVRRAERQRPRRRVRVRADADHLDARRPRARCRPLPPRTADGIGYHLKIDTGMNRLGFRHDNLRRTLPSVLAARTCALEAVYTHFATADEPGHALFDEQRARFERRCANARRARRRLPRGTPRTARRCCATRASGTTSCVRACCSTASCRRRSRRRFRSSRSCRSPVASSP